MNKKIRRKLELHFYAVCLWRIFCFVVIKENVYHFVHEMIN